MDKNVDDLVQAYVAEGGKAQDFMTQWQAQFSIAPTDPVPFVRERLVAADGSIERELALAAWDFRPAWRTDAKPLINARLETVAELPTFRKAFLARRAIVPMTGYFEWTGPAKAKQPHFIHAGGELLSAAGLYEWRKDDAGDWQASTVVITRTGQDRAGQVHDRMPCFLLPDAFNDWLDPVELDTSAKSDVLALLDHSSVAVAATLSTHPVDRRVNSVQKIDPADPSLIAPVDS